jgi:hypothetical protein
VPAAVLDGVSDGVRRSVSEAPPLPLPVGPIA